MGAREPLAYSPAASARTPRAPIVDPPRIATWFPLVLAGATAAATVFLVVLPFELERSSGAAASGGWWGRTFGGDGPVGALRGVSSAVTLLLGPLVAMLVAAWASTWAFLSWPQLRGRDRALLLAATLVTGTIAALDLTVWSDITRTLLD